MRLPSLKETISGITVGAIDLASHYVDAKQKFSKPFENVTDIYRLAVVLGGMGYYSMKGDAMGLVLFDNGLPLLTESVAYGVADAMHKKLPGAPTADPVNVVTVTTPPSQPPFPRPGPVPAVPAATSSVNLV